MLNKGHLLVVEDDSDIRTAMVAILEDEGFQVTAHEDGRAALEFLRASVTALPSLILLDLMMPIMNGWEFREQQLADPKLHKIPVVVVTAHDPRQQLAIDAAAILCKPVWFETLLKTIERCALAPS